MATPAKKASPSLSDLVKKNDNKNAEEKEVETPPVDKENSDSKKDQDVVESNKDAKPGNVVVQPEKPVDNQVDNVKSKDDSGNPNGVNFATDANVINKTPADMAAETPAETAKRYGINDKVPQDVHDNPNVAATNDNKLFQIPGGTHVHPDVARDSYNRMVGGRPSESGQVTVTDTQMVFAQPAEFDDKGINNPQPENLAD